MADLILGRHATGEGAMSITGAEDSIIQDLVENGDLTHSSNSSDAELVRYHVFSIGYLLKLPVVVG